MDKPQIPPSGDKHDYLSQATYYWPDPSKPGGLPYIQRDGQRNPEIDAIPDAGNLARLVSRARTLALAYYFSGDERYAERAAWLLRTWFLDPAKRMNPNLNYGQYTPGRNTGRGIGLIDSRGLNSIGDDLGLLADSASWSEADQQGMDAWFRQYLDWLQTSKNGRDESKEQNNHGSYYNTQVLAIALFLDQNDLARQVAEKNAGRIAAQVEPDGKQPLELRRTRAWSYSLFNLEALFDLAALGERAGVDLWSATSAEGRSPRAALDFLVPYALAPETWPYQQLTPWSHTDLIPLLLQAAAKYQEPAYLEVARQLAGDKLAADLAVLLYPSPRSGS
jgi:hypothetical protein